MLATETIAFAFKLINFGAFVGLAIYLFLTKVKDPLLKSMQEKEVFWQNLKINERSLIDHNNKLALEVALQDQQAQDFLKKIATWSHVVDNVQDQLNQEVKIYRVHAQARAEQQKNHRAMQKLITEITPLVIKDSSSELKTYYSKEEHAQQYINNIVDFMKKS